MGGKKKVMLWESSVGAENASFLSTLVLICIIFHLHHQLLLFSVVPYEMCPVFCSLLVYGLDFLVCIYIVKELMGKMEPSNCLKRINTWLIRRYLTLVVSYDVQRSFLFDRCFYCSVKKKIMFETCRSVKN